MKRLAILLVATAAVVALLVGIREPDEPAAISAPPATGPHESPTATEPSGPHFRSGTALGKAHTDYGKVRLRVVTAHGRIVRVDVLDMPHENRIDRELSGPAVRALTRAVLRVQSVNLDLVTGATYTSDGYIRSLQAALDKLS